MFIVYMTHFITTNNKEMGYCTCTRHEFVPAHKLWSLNREVNRFSDFNDCSCTLIYNVQLKRQNITLLRILYLNFLTTFITNDCDNPEICILNAVVH